ncbi:MAG: hypothetical protein AAGJ96_11290 [Pseudomonadota bacterium]
MRRTTLAVTLIALGALSACGSTMSDRALSGGGIGLASGVVLGAPGAAAIIGAGVGALTDQSQVDLGEPIWK